MARRTLDEHLERIKKLSGIISENEQADVDQAEEQIENMLDDPEVIDNFADGIGELLDDVTDELDTLGDKVGDKDGELEPIINALGESVLNEAEPISLTIGTLLAAPKIADMLGKGIKQIGKSADIEVVRKAGDALSKAGHKVHDKYKSVIIRALKAMPEYKNKYTDEQLELVANGILLAATVGFGIMSLSGVASAIESGNAALAAVEGGLTGVKATEVASGAKTILPRILNGLMS